MNQIKSGFLVLLILIPGLLLADYWQQKVIYDIDVELIDSLNQITGHEKITYINNSPDDLNYIWMHLWPNAYKSNKTALGQQKFKGLSTKMHFLPDSSFGWIEISNVSSDNQAINWEYRSEDTLDVAKFLLDQPLKSGDTLSFELDFIVKIPVVLSRLGHFGNHYELTQWYPKPAVYDRKGWHPMSYLDMGEFYSEWGDFDVSITLPKNYRVAATGVLQDSSEIAWRDSLAQIGNSYIDSFQMEPTPKLPGLTKLINKKVSSSKTLKTITYKQSNVHDFAWFADKRFVIMKAESALPSGQSYHTWTFALPKNLKNYRLSNEYIKDAVSFYSKSFMEYPYAHATVVDGDFSAGGGMEYPMITLINNTNAPPLLELVIMHEVGHNWFYGLSASNERDFPWMDEGLNSYAENLYWADKYADDYMLALHDEEPNWYAYVRYLLKDVTKSAVEDLAYYMSAHLQMDQAPNLHSEAFTDFNYGMMVYKKAALSTESLHAYLGDAMMDSVWHTYFNTWAYKHPQPEDIRQVFETVTGENLSWYFDDMIGSTGRIDYGLESYNSLPQGHEYETTVHINNHGDFSPPVAIGLSGESVDETKTSWVNPTGVKNVFKIQTSFPVKSVTLDPDFKLMDVKRSNNNKNLNLKFDIAQVSINPHEDYIINLIPYIWYDSIDLVSPGIILSHKNFISWSGVDWYLRTFIGPVTKKAGFTAAIGKKIFPKQGKEVYFHSRYMNDWSYRLAEVSTNFRSRNIKLHRDEQNIKVTVLAQDLSHGTMFVNNDAYVFFDSTVWGDDQYLKVSLSFKKKTRRTLWNNDYEFKGTIGGQKEGKPFLKLESHFNYRKRYSRNGSIRATIFANYAMGDVPNQDRFYFSTTVDPELSSKMIFSRNNDWYTPGHLIMYSDHHTIPGYQYSDDSGFIPSSTALLGTKLSTDIPTMESLSVLAGFGFAMDQDDESLEFIASLSTLFSMGPFKIVYVPVILESGELNSDWKRFEMNFTIDGPSINIGI